MEKKKLIDVTNTKLRLLVTTKCPNHCPMCCNNGWDFSKLPIVERWNYDQIMITGGEPLLFTPQVCDLVRSIRSINRAMGLSPQIFIYTAIADKSVFFDVLKEVDGVVYTPHSKSDLRDFYVLNDIIRQDKRLTENKSMRLNLFANVKAMLSQNIDLSMWQMKDMEWIENCPVPQGEDFRRIAELYD